MPLRNHFRPPTSQQGRWESLHAGWPMVMVQHLFGKLPPGFRLEPHMHLGTVYEIDLAATGSGATWSPADDDGGGGVATAVRTATGQTLAVDVDPPDPDEFEVRVYDEQTGGRLVAAIEIVSPGNKDRDDSRDDFVGKCVALLARGVCVSIVDPVADRPANLYAELLKRVDRTDPAADPPGPAYAVTHRWRKRPRRTRAESWYAPLAVGLPLPELPVWLDDTRAVGLDLEATYQETCKFLGFT
jgi:hypothetical protein